MRITIGSRVEVDQAPPESDTRIGRVVRISDSPIETWLDVQFPDGSVFAFRKSEIKAVVEVS